MSRETVLAPTLGALDLPPREGLKKLSSMGFRAVQLSATQPGMRPRDLDESARRDLRATLRRLELKCAGIDLWIPAEHFLSAEHQDRVVSVIHDTLLLAQFFDHCPVGLNLPRAKSDSQSARAVLAAIVDHSARCDVPIADHALPWNEDTQVGIGLDPAAVLAVNRDSGVEAARLGDRLVSARLADLSTAGMRCPVGRSDGRLDVQAYRVALEVSGYERPVVIDARQWTDPIKGIETSRKAYVNAGIVAH